MNVKSLESSKAKVVAIYDLMFNAGRPAESVERYVGAKYRQHNPDIAGGKTGFVDYFEGMAADDPGQRVEFKRILADGEFVVLRCHQVWPDDECAGVNIFRLDVDGKVVEH